MRIAIMVEEKIMPKQIPWRNCECMKEPVDLSGKRGTLVWLKEVGESVAQGEVVCEGEVDKKTVEFVAPQAGILIEQCIDNHSIFRAGDILGYIQ